MGLPVYNAESYLEETLDSLLSQTFSDFELIISDNASTDRTADICAAYAAQDQRIRYYRNDVNLGAAPNYNRTFELATGEYFKWMAYDDPCAPTCLERCVTTLDVSPEAIMCYPKTVVIDEQGEVICNYAYEDGFDLRQDEPHLRLRQFFDIGILCHPVFGLIRRDVLARTALIGSYPSSDRVLLGELSLLGKCYEIPEHLAYRRVHANNSFNETTTQAELWHWFDPNVKVGHLNMRQRCTVEYFRNIKRAPLSASERTKCYAEVARYHLQSGRIGKSLQRLNRGKSQEAVSA
jgi:glycosyltransferase involved in cell wall biosynthesis